MAALWIGFVGLPDWARSEPELVDQPVIVEIVTVSEETRAARPKPEPVKEDRTPPLPPRKLETPPVPAEPEPEDAVVVPETKPEPPKKIAKPKRKPASTPKKVVKAKPAPPKAAATAPKSKPKSKRYKFDADRIAVLGDKTPRKRSAPDAPETPRTPPEVTSRTAQPLEGQPLTLSEVDALRAQIERCWIVQAGARYAEDLVVKIRVFLRPDGSLRREPQIVDDGRMAADPFFRAAAESAVRAVLKCEPFKMPIAKHHRWREIELTFDPSEILG